MKTMFRSIFALMLALCLLALAGCGQNNSSNGSSGDNGSNSSDGEDSNTPSVYAFTSGDVTITMNAPAAELVEALGEPINYFENPSCAFQGTDRIYTYDGFQITTYPLNDTDYISSVMLTSDAVSTAEGLEIGGSKEDMIAAYGEDYAEETGQFTYTKGDSQLVILIENDLITSIEYQAVLPEA